MHCTLLLVQLHVVSKRLRDMYVTWFIFVITEAKAYPAKDYFKCLSAFDIYLSSSRRSRLFIITPTLAASEKVYWWSLQTCSSALARPRPEDFPPGSRTCQFLVSFPRYDRLAREGTLSRCLWRAPAAQNNTLRTNLTSRLHCTESVPKTFSRACSATPSWRMDKWTRSPNCLSNDRPTPSARLRASKVLAGAS